MNGHVWYPSKCFFVFKFLSCSTDCLEQIKYKQCGTCTLSELSGCHPPPKMATAENPTSCKATFYHVIRHASLQVLTCEQILDIPNSSYNDKEQPNGALAFFGGKRVTRSKLLCASPSADTVPIYTVTQSFLTINDQLWWSDNFIQSGRQDLEKSRGTWMIKNFEVYCLLSRLTDGTGSNKQIPCGLLIQGLRPDFNHPCGIRYSNT